MTAAQNPEDLDALRNKLRVALRADTPRRGSTLADMQTRQAKGEQKLRRPSAKYVNARGEEVKKPEWGQWTTLVHATPTRPPGYSRENITELDWMDSHCVKAIWQLQTAHIQNILARYAPTKERRANASRHLAQHTASGFPTRTSRERARIIALTLILNPWAERRLHEVFDMTPDQWRSSRHRRLVSDIKAKLNEIDVAAIQAWSARKDGIKKSA